MKASWLVAGWVVGLAGSALADVPGPKPVCSAPAVCIGCSVSDGDCEAAAIDAGLVHTSCTTQRGTPVTYYCPPGVEPVQQCGCASVTEAGACLTLLAFSLRARKPKTSAR